MQVPSSLALRTYISPGSKHAPWSAEQSPTRRGDGVGPLDVGNQAFQGPLCRRGPQAGLEGGGEISGKLSTNPGFGSCLRGAMPGGIPMTLEQELRSLGRRRASRTVRMQAVSVCPRPAGDQYQVPLSEPPGSEGQSRPLPGFFAVRSRGPARRANHCWAAARPVRGRVVGLTLSSQRGGIFPWLANPSRPGQVAEDLCGGRCHFVVPKRGVAGACCGRMGVVPAGMRD